MKTDWCREFHEFRLILHKKSMDRAQRLNAFIALGKHVHKFLQDTTEFSALVFRAHQQNGWFTEKHARIAFEGMVQMLEPNTFTQWAAQYTEPTSPKTVGVVMAGNIPLAGLHDFICILLSGHAVKAKLSSQDTIFMKQIAEWLIAIEPAFRQNIEFAERLKEIDAVIATGSDNTSRYFEYYFRHMPHIIRKNRVSFGVLTGSETDAELDALADDIFLHFGLGCRNVSKLFLPKGYAPESLLARWTERMEEAKLHHKYMNNYDYNRAVYLINLVPHLDGGGLMLKKDNALVSPVSVVFYEHYTSLADFHRQLEAVAEKVQCVVAHPEVIKTAIPFGQAQFPNIDDYADGVDTMRFLADI